MDEVRLNRNKNINHGYRKLEVWQEAIELFKFVRENIYSIQTISYNIKAQIEDSILSVSSNIAEGYCRGSLKENVQFNNIALSSLDENFSQIYALLNSGIIIGDCFDDYYGKHCRLENKLIKMNKSLVQNLDNKNWKDDYILREGNDEYSHKVNY